MRMAAVTTSSTSLNGEANPSPKSGAAASCRASAPSATMRAARTLPGVACVGSLEGAVELVGSIDDLLREGLVDGIDGGVELFDRRRPEEDRIDPGPGRDPLVRELHRRAPGLRREPPERFREIEEAVAEIPLLVQGVLLEARAGRKRIAALQLARQEAARERIVDGGVDAVLAREAEVLDLQLAHEQVVHLLRDARFQAEVRHLQQLPGGEVRGAERADLAARDQLLHGPKRRRELAGVIGLVEVVELHPVGAEPGQALVEGRGDPLRRETLRVRHARAEPDLGGDAGLAAAI